MLSFPKLSPRPETEGGKQPSSKSSVLLLPSFFFFLYIGNRPRNAVIVPLYALSRLKRKLTIFCRNRVEHINCTLPMYLDTILPDSVYLLSNRPKVESSQWTKSYHKKHRSSYFQPKFPFLLLLSVALLLVLLQKWPSNWKNPAVPNESARGEYWL